MNDRLTTAPSLPPDMCEIVLVRHAEAFAQTQMPQGVTAPALSERGINQASAVAERLQQSGVAAIFSSPTPRAVATATIIQQALAIPLTIEDDLREIAIDWEQWPDEMGALQLAVPQIQARLIEAQALTLGTWTPHPRQQVSREVRQRMLGAIERIAARHHGQRVVLVSHNGAINAYCAAFLGIRSDFFVVLAPTSLSLVQVQGHAHQLLRLGDVMHVTRMDIQHSPDFTKA